MGASPAVAEPSPPALQSSAASQIRLSLHPAVQLNNFGVYICKPIMIEGLQVQRRIRIKALVANQSPVGGALAPYSLLIILRCQVYYHTQRTIIALDRRIW